jgi:hypothetical protein
MDTKKHYHVLSNEELFLRHRGLEKQVACLSMVLPGAAKEAVEGMQMAAAIIQNDQDVTETEVNQYIWNMQEAIMVARDLAPLSDLAKELTDLLKDTIEYVTHEPHDPTQDEPSQQAKDFVSKILQPLMRAPYLVKGENGEMLLPVRIVEARLSRALKPEMFKI